jgi:hypothetical protein
MKFITFLIIFIFSSFIVSSQIVKNPPQTFFNSIINPLAGDYARVDVTMGYVKGTGRVIFGNPSQSKYTPFNEFSFLIYVAGSKDIQFGKISNIRVETSNLNDYLFKFDWKNNRTDQGTISAEIQLFYSYTKNRYETYFINNSSSVFKIFWWTELEQQQKDALNSAIYGLFKKEIDKKNAEIYRQKRIDDSLQVIKNRQILEEQKRIDSINRYKDSVTKRNNAISDSIALIKKRYQDSIQKIILVEEERIRIISQRSQDSITKIENAKRLIKEKKDNNRRKARLNYWGFGFSFNNIDKTDELLINNAWKYITREGLSLDGKPIDGSANGYSFFISRRLISLLGIEFMWSEYRDGSYKNNENTTNFGTSTPRSITLFKNSFFSTGPIFTIPIKNSNIDFKYLFTYSRAVFKDPTGNEIEKRISTSSGSIMGGGFRFPLGKGETLSSNKFSLGQLGVYYDLYKSNFNFTFGTLPSYNSAITIKYINSIN